jgi:quercetin dioxygenase-like cupin family protein
MAIVQDYRAVPAEPAYDGVSMQVPIGPEQGAPHFNMRIFEVQPGQSTPHHQHWWEHEVFVLAGEGTLHTEAGDEPISAGTVALIPGDEWHHFHNPGPGLLRFICLVPQEWLHGLAPQP